MVARPAVVALTLAVLPLAACGSKSSSGTTTTSAPAAVEDAARKTIDAGTEHLAVKAAANSGGQVVTLTGTGDFDSKQSRGKLHASVGLGGVQTAIDEVLDGTTAYVSSTLLNAFLPAGKSWLKIDLSTAGKALGIDTNVLRLQDPGYALAQLKALQRVHEVGTATVGGVQTTRYRGTIDAAKLPQASADALSKSGTKLGPVDVWVGDDGYVHRERVTTITSAGKNAKTVVSTTLSKFGEPVLVSVPADSETVDASTVTIPGLGG